MTDAPTTPDPMEIAMEVERGDVRADSPARRLLVDQGRLVRWQIASERAGFALKVLGAVAGLVLAAALGLMAWQASRADGVVIEAFSAPPDLAARGLTGQVLASQLQDRLTRLQAATYSVRPQASYTSGFGDEIKVEIPSTGVSIGELQRFLRAWLGHETRVTGELYRTADGQLALTVRASGQDGADVSGSDATLPDLLQRSAEALYARTQPYRYAMYLKDRGQIDAARAVLTRLAESGPASERAWAKAGLSSIEPDRALALALAQQATTLDPRLAEAWRARWAAGLRLENDAESAAAARKFVALLGGRGRGGYAERVALQGKYVQAWLADHEYDRLTSRRLYLEVMNAATDERLRNNARLSAAIACAFLREATCARSLAGGPDDGELTRRMPPGRFSDMNSAAALWIEDWPEVVRQTEATVAAMRANAGPISPEERINSNIRPSEVRALVMLGRLDEARAIVAAMPTDCQNCRQVRGILAAAAGDRAGTDYWYGQAVQRRAVGGAHARWGVVTHRLLHDPDAAIVHLRTAHDLAPKAADPLEAWGEALIDKRDYRGAAAKFAEAEKRAPKWGRLNVQWGIALARLGKTTEARAKWTKALTLDLSPADRAQAQALLAGGKA